MKHSRKYRIASIAMAGSLIFAACSDDTEPVATEQTADPAPATDDAATSDSESMVDMMGAFGPACDAVPTEGDGSFAGMADDPAATAASANPLLSTLVTAVGEAGLVDTLNGDGPFTIFAPTNDAFAAIPQETLDMVLADTDLLTTILTYHVIGGESLDADGLAGASTAATVEGGELSFGPDGTTVNDVDVLCSDVPTANATVHIIGEVLLPPAVQEMLAGGGDMAEEMTEESMAEGEMVESMALEPTGPGCAAVPADGEGSFGGMADDPAATAASNNPLLSTLVSAVGEAGLVDTLNGEGPFTIFAPVNDAFAAIPEADLAAVLADTDLLTGILTYHVIGGEKLSSADLIAAGTAQTVNGAELTFTEGSGGLEVDGAATLCMDVPTANATVHIIDTVLMPGA